MRRDLLVLLDAILDKRVRRNLRDVNRALSVNPDWDARRLIHTTNAIMAHDPMVKHDGHFVINSFLPPVDTQAYRRMAMETVPGLGTPEFLTNQIVGKRTAPISTYIAVTSRCPYSCWHCSAARFSANDHPADMSTEELRHVIDALLGLGVAIIGFTGGEPLLRADLEQAVRLASDGGATTFVFTSGPGLSPERAASLKEAGLFGVAVSYDCADPGPHDRKRGHDGAHATAVRALESCVGAGLYTMTQTVCTREMLESGEMLRIAESAARLGVLEMRIIEPLPCGCLEGDSSATLSAEEKRHLIDLHVAMNSDPTLPKAAVFAYTESDAQFGCGAGLQHSYVDTAGNLLPCDFVNQPFGNLLEEPAADIWARVRDTYSAPRCECHAKCPNAAPKTPGFYRRLAGERVPAVE